MPCSSIGSNVPGCRGPPLRRKSARPQRRPKGNYSPPAGGYNRCPSDCRRVANSSRKFAAMTRIPATLALATLAAVALAAFALALSVGSIALDPMTVLRALAGGGDPMPRTIVHELRLPRALAAFATG